MHKNVALTNVIFVDLGSSLKPSYDCDLVVDDVEGAPDPVRGEPRTGHPTGCPNQARPDHPVVCRLRVDMNICVCGYHPQSASCADITLNLRRS